MLVLHMEVSLVCIDGLVVKLIVVLVNLLIEMMWTIFLLTAAIVRLSSCTFRLGSIKINHFSE